MLNVVLYPVSSQSSPLKAGAGVPLLQPLCKFKAEFTSSGVPGSARMLQSFFIISVFQIAQTLFEVPISVSHVTSMSERRLLWRYVA